jgi:1,4-dihydroxy-2-naphthoate octaprenyltransferase
MSKQSKLFQNSETFERATLDLHGENHKSFYYKDLWFSPKADFKSNRLLKSAQSILNFFAVVEIRTKLVSVTTLAVALLYVWWRAGFPRVAPLVLMWAATLAVDMGTTAFNNYFDYVHGTDRYRDVNEPDKVVARGHVGPSFAFWSAFWCFCAAVVLGFFTALSSTLWIIPIGVVCMLAGFCYTGGPLPISRTPVGELFAGGFLGMVLFGIANRVWGVAFDGSVLLAGVPSSLWIAAILMVNNTCDIEGDREAGRKTLAIRLGPGAGELFVILYGLSGFAFGILASIIGVFPRAHLATLPVALLAVIPFWHAMHRDGYTHATKGRNMQRILKILLLSSIGMLAGFVADMM